MAWLSGGSYRLSTGASEEPHSDSRAKGAEETRGKGVKGHIGTRDGPASQESGSNSTSSPDERWSFKRKSLGNFLRRVMPASSTTRSDLRRHRAHMSTLWDITSENSSMGTPSSESALGRRASTPGRGTMDLSKFGFSMRVNWSGSETEVATPVKS